MPAAVPFLPAITAGLGAIGAGATAVTALTGKDKPKIAPVPTFSKKKAETKAANQAAEANRRRVMAETDTVKTTALGNTGATETKKKTLLGG